MTILFSLYASGYRISLLNIIKGKSLIQKTGILAIDSSPKGAEISLINESKGLFSSDNILKNKKIKTPYKIKNIIPGNYNLALNLDGYWPWQQKITIYPGQTTYIEDVFLFKRNLPVNFLSSPVQNVCLDSLGQKIILKNDNSLIDLKSEQNVNLGEGINNINFLDSKKILINNSLIFDYSKNKYFNIYEEDLNESNKIKLKGNSVFYLKNGLKSYDLFSKKIENIFSLKGLIDYDFYNNFYFLIVSENDNIFLKIYSYRDRSFIKNISLPSSGDYEILSISGSSSFVYIYDKNFKTIYVINTSSKFNNYWAIINNVKGFDFIDSNNFVYFSDFEIYIFNSLLSESFLIGRYDLEIKSLVWHPKNYIVYSTYKDIVILDLKYNKYAINLISLEKVSNLVLDKSRSILYFTGKIGNQEGLYKFFIQ